MDRVLASNGGRNVAGTRDAAPDGCGEFTPRRRECRYRPICSGFDPAAYEHRLCVGRHLRRVLGPRVVVLDRIFLEKMLGLRSFLGREVLQDEHCTLFLAARILPGRPSI